MPDTYTCARTTTIAAPASAVYERLVDFHRWRAWSPFEELDPGMQRTYAGSATGVGAVYEWSGNLKAGTGRMEIVEAVPGSRVGIEQHNLKPFKSESAVGFDLLETGGTTTVTWTTSGRLGGVTRLVGLFSSMEKVLGPVQENGLKMLKVDAEDA